MWDGNENGNEKRPTPERAKIKKELNFICGLALTGLRKGQYLKLPKLKRS
jgi:hypothetical protein